MSVSIRLAETHDEQKCRDLLAMLTHATSSKGESFSSAIFQKLISNERGSLFVAEENSRVLGMASVSFNLALRYSGEYAQLEELIVDPDARGKNVGGLLVEETLKRAKLRGCKEFGLYLLESTRHNQLFYEKYGFVSVGSEMRQPL